MRDLVVREGLATMARDAARLFKQLIAAGAEIPYEVREPGNGSPLCQYEPLTGRFVREHVGALRELDSFGAACAAIEATDLAGKYLEEMGVNVPVDAKARAELAGTAFLCRLWMDSTDFSLDRDRLEAAIDELEAGGEAAEGEIEVIVPLRGLQMPVVRLDLATASIVRADTVDVPAEARATEGMGAAGWEPTFLAVTRLAEPDPDAADVPDVGTLANEAFLRLITTLRLFKAGGVSLGPHAWTKVAGDRWRRIATGAGRPRPGGYRLTEAELGELAGLSRALVGPSTPFGRHLADRPGLPAALGRAISRFEAGLERHVVLEALNDYLLCLRFLLEGGGPADLGLPMRVAALCAEPEQRDAVKAVVDRAVALERELWSGEPGVAGPPPAKTAIELENLARAILRDAACGHLGSELRATADEILLADGFAVGEGAIEQRGATAEWEVADGDYEDPDAEHEGVDEQPVEEAEPFEEAEPADEEEPLEDEPEEEQVFGRAGRIMVEAHRQHEEHTVIPRAQPSEPPADERPTTTLDVVPPMDPADELGDVAPSGAESSPVLQLIAQTRAERRARADRMANLFPRPDDCDWNVRELGYDRRRGRATVP
ncbi:MAG TPA: hypothetical protein VHJ54_11980 [Solirubrobacterales bacterium]|jgi:hypothetical protein|nr:hypothetical protein [Solirubrobacterales bacterium]